MRFNHWLGALMLGACVVAQAQSSGASPAKKELVQKLLALQQPGIELAARGMVERPAALMLQEAGRVVQTQVPAEKREAVAKTIEADAKRYVEEAFPPVRERALKIAPATLGAALEEKFTEDELKQLIAWFDSPVNKKFQAASGEMQNNFMQKLVAEARPLLEPKLQALEQKVRAALGAPAAPPAAPAGDAAKPAAKPAAKASGK
ncbi:MAG TPA: DUF2059 domain-containing protein [Rubrivivax sp.]|nr:DUF2059 domain-containing protein [Rubrivivax sp.]HPO19320.1 DUF2059 domain-containing protein [Rubrivivax sp.]